MFLKKARLLKALALLLLKTNIRADIDRTTKLIVGLTFTEYLHPLTSSLRPSGVWLNITGRENGLRPVEKVWRRIHVRVPTRSTYNKQGG
jgi:hypothetical protein